MIDDVVWREGFQFPSQHFGLETRYVQNEAVRLTANTLVNSCMKSEGGKQVLQGSDRRATKCGGYGGTETLPHFRSTDHDNTKITTTSSRFSIIPPLDVQISERYYFINC